MKKILIGVCVAVFVAPAFAELPIDPSKEYEMRMMGIEEDREFSFPEGVESDTYSGSLTAASPTWDRIFGSAVDLTCNAAMSDSSNDGQYYEEIPIQVTATENLEAEVISFTGGDTVIALYCDPFDPANPGLNAIAYDDDDGVGTLSAFVAGDGITLQPGNTYYLVFSTFSGAVVGDFTINFTSATVTVVPVELQSFLVE